MIISTILSLSLFWSTRTCVKSFQKLLQLKKKIGKSPILSISEALKQFDSLPAGSKIFMIVKGTTCKNKA